MKKLRIAVLVVLVALLTTACTNGLGVGGKVPKGTDSAEIKALTQQALAYIGMPYIGVRDDDYDPADDFQWMFTPAVEFSQKTIGMPRQGTFVDEEVRTRFDVAADLNGRLWAVKNWKIEYAKQVSDTLAQSRFKSDDWGEVRWTGGYKSGTVTLFYVKVEGDWLIYRVEIEALWWTN